VQSAARAHADAGRAGTLGRTTAYLARGLGRDEPRARVPGTKAGAVRIVGRGQGNADRMCHHDFNATHREIEVEQFSIVGKF
jgi:hypothetical protein